MAPPATGRRRQRGRQQVGGGVGEGGGGGGGGGSSGIPPSTSTSASTSAPASTLRRPGGFKVGKEHIARSNPAYARKVRRQRDELIEKAKIKTRYARESKREASKQQEHGTGNSISVPAALPADEEIERLRMGYLDQDDLEQALQFAKRQKVAREAETRQTLDDIFAGGDREGAEEQEVAAAAAPEHRLIPKAPPPPPPTAKAHRLAREEAQAQARAIRESERRAREAERARVDAAYAARTRRGQPKLGLRIDAMLAKVKRVVGEGR